MSWALFRAIRSRPLIRLCTRNDVLRTSATSSRKSNDVKVGDIRVSKLFEKQEPITEADWTKIREMFLKSPTVGRSNVDQLVVDFCDRNRNAFDNAMSYIDFLRANNVPISQYLQLKVIQVYTKTSKEGPLSEELEAKVIELCDGVLNAPESLKQTDAITIIVALSLTSEWRRCIDLIDKYKIKCLTPTLATFSLLAANAFWEDEPTIGWQLLDKIVEMDFAPQCVSFLAYWNYCELHRDDNFTERIEQMLEFIGTNDVIVSRNVMDGLQAIVEGVEIKGAKIDYRGNCSVCRQQLDNVRLPTIEFQKLKKEFEATSLSKANILARSSFGEFIRFKQIVNEKRSFHYVIDGLNVAYTGSTDKLLEQAKTLTKLVEHFVQRKKRVLIIGRKHMDDTWPGPQINFIKKNATLFLTANESDDDPYLLYATFVSGENTDFVSRDQMRTYSQRLSPAGRALFKQWQKQHQSFVIVDQKKGNSLKVQRPYKYKHFCHKNETQQWHVPYVEEAAVKLGKYLEADVQWACFTFEK